MTSPHPTSDPVPAMDDIQVGDVVHVRMHVVSRVSDSDVRVTQSDPTVHWTTVPIENIVHVEPRPLKAGDRVRPAGGGEACEILAIHESTAWVRGPHMYLMFSLSDLVRA